jgi:hypothetical protein
MTSSLPAACCGWVLLLPATRQEAPFLLQDFHFGCGVAIELSARRCAKRRAQGAALHRSWAMARSGGYIFL